MARALGGIGGGQDYGANKGTLIALDVYNQKADESGVTQPVAGGEGGNTMPHVAYSIHPDAIHRDGVAKSDSPDAEGVMRKRDAGLGIQEGIAHTLMSGEPPAVAATLQSGRRPGTSADDADGLVVEGPAWNGEDISPTLDAVKAAKQQMMPERGRFAGVVVPAPRDLFSFVPEIAAPLSAGSNPRSNAAGRRREDDENVVVTHTLKGEGHDASEDGTGRGVPLTVTPLQQPGLLAKQPAVGVGEPGDPMYTLAGMGVHAVAIDKTTPIETTGYQGDQVVPAEGVWPCLPAGGGNNGGGPGALLLADTKPVVTDAAMLRTHNLSDEKKGDVWMSARPGALSANFNEGGNQLQVAVVETDARPMAVRRLLPIECERLQGFPDNWTCLCDTPGIWTCQCPDSPRYKACGNAVTEVVACWIGTRMIEWDRRLLV